MRHMKISSGWDMYNVAVVELYKTEEKLRKAERVYEKWFSLARECVDVNELDYITSKKTNPAAVKVAKLRVKVDEVKLEIENIKASLESDIRSDEVWDNFLMVDQLRHG